MSANKTIAPDDLSHLTADDDEPTRVWVRPVFLGIPIPPWSADHPIPNLTITRTGRPTSNEDTKP